MKTIDERKKAFKWLIWEKIGCNYNKYPKEIVLEFYEHWSQTNDNGVKMYFEMEKRWSTLGRLATFKRNWVKWNKSDLINIEEPMPGYFNKRYWQNVKGDKIKEYKQHLHNLGWKYSSSPGGTYWQSPEGKIIWL